MISKTTVRDSNLHFVRNSNSQSKRSDLDLPVILAYGCRESVCQKHVVRRCFVKDMLD